MAEEASPPPEEEEELYPTFNLMPTRDGRISVFAGWVNEDGETVHTVIDFVGSLEHAGVAYQLSMRWYTSLLEREEAE